MEKQCKICLWTFNTNIERVFCCSKGCMNLYKKSDEFKNNKYEYDKNRRKTSIKWKETHTKYYINNSKHIYQKRKNWYLLNLSEDKKNKLIESKIKYSKSTKWLLKHKNNFAIRWIKHKYPWRYIEDITYEQLLNKFHEINWICIICKNNLIPFDMDHKISLKNWWEHTINNIHFICHSCNMRKWSKNIDEI